MPYLFNLIYLLLLVVSLPWLIYSAIRKGKYRQGWAAKFLGRVPIRKGTAPCIWLHAVSVGEVNLLQPLLRRLIHDRPGIECVISTTTRTGYELAKKKYSDYTVFYCPLDFSWAVNGAMRRIRPDLLILAELELWPNLIDAARRHGAAVAVINGRLSEHSFRGYQRIRPIIARSLKRISLIAAQNEEYADRFRQLGAASSAVQITGSIKFDGVQTDRSNAATRELAKLWNVSPDDKIFLAGSTMAPEEETAVGTIISIASQHPEWRLIIVPRHPERFAEVGNMLSRRGVTWQKRSQLERAGFDPNARVLLVDAVGELGVWWGVANVGFVGGSLGRRGGQNMIEPAAFGVAACFGPNTWNFRDVVAMLLEAQGAAVVQDQNEMERFLLRCIEQPEFARQLGHSARELVLRQQGATERTSQMLLNVLQTTDNTTPTRSCHAA